MPLRRPSIKEIPLEPLVNIERLRDSYIIGPLQATPVTAVSVHILGSEPYFPYHPLLPYY